MASERSFACVVSRYPAVSHAFIVREVRALRARGVDVHTFTIRRPGDEELLSAADRDEHARTFAVLPARPLALAAAHLRALASHPLRYAATLGSALRLAPPGLRQRLWRAFYFVEAILVWSECRPPRGPPPARALRQRRLGGGAPGGPLRRSGVELELHDARLHRALRRDAAPAAREDRRRALRGLQQRFHARAADEAGGARAVGQAARGSLRARHSGLRPAPRDELARTAARAHRRAPRAGEGARAADRGARDPARAGRRGRCDLRRRGTRAGRARGARRRARAFRPRPLHGCRRAGRAAAPGTRPPTPSVCPRWRRASAWC